MYSYLVVVLFVLFYELQLYAVSVHDDQRECCTPCISLRVVKHCATILHAGQNRRVINVTLPSACMIEANAALQLHFRAPFRFVRALEPSTSKKGKEDFKVVLLVPNSTFSCDTESEVSLLSTIQAS